MPMGHGRRRGKNYLSALVWLESALAFVARRGGGFARHRGFARNISLTQTRGIYGLTRFSYDKLAAAGIAESQFAGSPWTPLNAKPRVRRGVCKSYRSRKEGRIMIIPMLLVLLVLIRKRRTGLRIEIDL